MFAHMIDDWEMTWAGNAKDALDYLRKRTQDVLVADFELRGVGCVELLDLAKRRFPKVARIVLTGESERKTALSLMGISHSCISKPCDAELLKGAISRACALRDLMCGQELRKLVGEMESIPSLPYVYLEIMEAIRLDKASLAEIAEIVSRDMSMCAKVLRVANSGWLGVQRSVSTVGDAISLLGMDNLQAMVLTTHMFSQVPHDRLRRLSLDGLWEFCSWLAAYASRIAVTERLCQREIDDASMAGFLHGLGTLLLALNMPDRYRACQIEARKRNIPIWRAETELLGASHAELAAYLLSMWQVPPGIVNAVAWSHRPSLFESNKVCPVAIVHVAHSFATACQSGSESDPDAEIDLDMTNRLRLTDKIPIWRKLCGAFVSEQDQAA
jgi:HD-like signal output (HDOD) protein